MRTHTPSLTMLSATAIVLLAVSPLFVAAGLGLQLTTTPEYTSYVQTCINSPQGNYTYIEKPVFPVLINNSQIQIGANWTIICPLQANHNYHIYCYGAWINTSSAASTDYDFYVYDPQGNLVSSHIQSAGLPPHLGTTTDNPLFTPTQSGNYSFVMVNNPYTSSGAQQATFMIIESLQTDQWQTCYLEGNGANASLYGAWAYEFITNASQVQVYINVPDSLSVYEARLYLMNNGQSSTLDSYPLPWEPGLYGNLSGTTGGYNFNSNGYRGVAYTSNEYAGQDLFLNYTSSNKGVNLYQLVLLGGQGSGNLQVMMKTSVQNSTLTQQTSPQKFLPNQPINLSYTSNNISLQSAKLTYTTDDWNHSNTINMQVSDMTCNCTIPGQIAGTPVQYQINATDTLENSLSTSGNFTVKQLPTLNITADAVQLKYDSNITINGTLRPAGSQAQIQVEFLSSNSIETINCTTDSNGEFNATYKPNASGKWAVMASCNETQTNYPGESNGIIVTVAPPPIYVKYGLYILGVFGGIVGAGVAVWFFKFRGR